ncbi:exodeoxyribonuclease V subunit beta [Collimonas sp.]|jgi:exodeoxyribonuclease V beta subunit|uniref:exodeoxyribonuclease V subunit beta n=1 Tax=Collimonas sp. TaxID=1963772 RepID=UPI0037C04A9B
MSQALIPLHFPLKGSRLIEASAGTGKTWTIAALYVRLVLGHGGEEGFGRALSPSEILVMTFTRAATRELTERIRARLVEAAAYFRGLVSAASDPFLLDLIASYPADSERLQAAHLLMMAAEAMDDCAIFTIDAWCQRMLREHAFDSGCLFDEELVSSENSLFSDAVRDYWRQHVYPLDGVQLAVLRDCWPNLESMEKAMRQLVNHVAVFGAATAESLGQMIIRVSQEQKAHVAAVKPGWAERAERMEAWIADNRTALSGTTLKAATVATWINALRAWATDPDIIVPGADFDKAWEKLTLDNLLKSCKKGHSVAPRDDFAQLVSLQQQLMGLEPIGHYLMRHAATRIAQRMAELKRRTRQFGFADMLARLRAGLEGSNGKTLARRITTQYPVALIDEFQDTSPDQYRIFDLLYQVANTQSSLGLFLIGDPKQAIYGFRGADIRSYLDARQATAGRHYLLGTNFRSSETLVEAVNQAFLHAEGQGAKPGHPAGAFRFRKNGNNPLPFENVLANGRKERLVCADDALTVLTIWCNQDSTLKADDYRAHFAAQCAEQIVTLLNDPEAGFASQDDKFERLKPADIAVLVRDRYEAAAVRRALQQRKVASVYLSDKDSVFDSVQAADVLLWLQAVANPLVGSLARAAFATRTAGLSLSALATLAADDLAWEARVEQLKALRLIWQRQGVLAMLRHFIHELGLPASLLNQIGGERSLTDLLHLAELLQSASQQLDGEQALIRWLAEQIDNDTDGGDERILRLESDAELVQVITVHKSKGLEYPLVFLPFAVSAKPVTRRNRSFFAFTDDAGQPQIDFSLTDKARAAMDAARIEEDVRLLYVALTRARHALWLGVASLDNKIDGSAFGYLLGGGADISSAQLMPALQVLRENCAGIRIQAADAVPARTPLSRADSRPPLIAAPHFTCALERNWAIASYTSITRDLCATPVPATPMAEKLVEDDDKETDDMRQDVAWHRFPRGALPGQFLHEQLEWMALEDFDLVDDARFDGRLRARCERAGWGHRQDDVVVWMHAIATTELPPLGAALCTLGNLSPEMEFWFAADGLATKALDGLCQTHLLEDLPRPPLSERQLNGMLRGFMDLVFEHAGRYWVLDYKSNALASGDGGYHKEALAEGMAASRYDVQGMIYLLALHRLLRSRLGANYDPARHLGGALFFFLRGLANADTHGCYHLQPDPALLTALDQLLPLPAHIEESA